MELLSGKLEILGENTGAKTVAISESKEGKTHTELNSNVFMELSI